MNVFKDEFWLSFGAPACNSLLNFICVCMGIAPTVAPTTPAPTLTPTVSPTSLRSGNITLVSDGTTYQGDLGDRATTNATCAAVVAGAGLVCNATSMLISYTGDEVINFPTKLDFSFTTPVYGPTGTLISSSWADMFLGGATSLSSSLNGASVGTTGDYWTGTEDDGTVYATCLEWTSALGVDLGGQGDDASTSNTWIETAPLLNNICSQLRDVVCLCFQASPLPTQAPTPAPTILPTEFTQPNPEIALYRAEVGTQIVIDGVLDSMNYCPSQTENEPPSRLGTFTPRTNLVPIWWDDLYYLEWTNNSTTTNYLDRCNPAYQAQPPGTATTLGPCPFLDLCGTLTTLDPLQWTTGGLAYEWPDLRGCVLNYTETERTDLTPLLANVAYEEVQA